MTLTVEERAKVLVEALPYIKRFHGQIVVIKVGGNAIDHARDETLLDVVLLRYVGMQPVLVHGGGPEISAMSERLGLKPEFKNGLRITDEKTMEVVKMVLTGKVSPDLVAAIHRLGGQAVGMSGEDGPTIIAEPLDEAMGFVGQVTQVNKEPITALLTRGYIPVIASIGRGDGCRIYDESGREYLDLVAGIAVNLLGHAHPDVVRAVSAQAGALIHTSNLYFTQPQIELARRLVKLSFPSRVFFCNSGAEANEAAIKLARKWGARNRDGAFQIITATGSFHGRTLATITAGGQPKYSDPFQPLPHGFVHVAFNDAAAIESATTDKTVAVMLEPVMGEIGIIPAATGYLKRVREWCDSHNLLLILDEVQTGLGRTGRWFAHQHAGITPDVMTLAKGLGGGVPIGACLANPRADVFEPGDHGSTFGGNPLACTAALAVLHVIERDSLVGHAAEMGEVLRDAIKDLGAKDLRGLGLMQAFEFEAPKAKQFQLGCLEAGLIVNAVDDHSIRLVPPLIITGQEIDRAHALMARVAG